MCRVPLLISHPQSPFQGQRYTEPVELVDIFPTVLDLFPVSPADKPCDQLYGDITRCLPLQGKSLAPVVLGTPVGDQTAPSALYNKDNARGNKKRDKRTDKKKDKKARRRVVPPPPRPLVAEQIMPSLGSDLFAVSQTWRCADKKWLLSLFPPAVNGTKSAEKRGGFTPWNDCTRGDNKKLDKIREQVSVMGYSFRSAAFRYTLWLHWDRVRNLPELLVPPYAEELYDHRRETLQNFTHLELLNLVHRPDFGEVARKLKAKALHFLEHDVKFMGPYDNRPMTR